MGMMYFQVEEDKVEKVSEHIEQGLRHLGKAMQCVEEMKSGGQMGQRGGYYGNRGGGEYMGERDDMERSYNGSQMGERRWGNQYGGGYTNRRDGGMSYRDPMMY